MDENWERTLCGPLRQVRLLKGTDCDLAGNRSFFGLNKQVEGFLNVDTLEGE